MKKLNALSVLLPAYKGSGIIRPTIVSLLQQTHRNFEIIIGNDDPTDHEKLLNLISSFNDQRIHLHTNTQNLGYPANIKKIIALAQHEILFCMCQDDIVIDSSTFTKILDVFNSDNNIGVITRPYYWFINNPSKPVRVVKKYHKRIISIDSPREDLEAVLETVGQLSGLVFRKSYIEHNFGDHVFPSHAYPFFSIMRHHTCYFWPDYMIAVWIEHSQTKTVSTIYNPSPTKTWIDTFLTVFKCDKYKRCREICINHFASNYLGLLQIKNYGRWQDLFADIYYLIKYRKKNILNLKFWFFVIGSILIPRSILKYFIQSYKQGINQNRLHKQLKIEQMDLNSKDSYFT